MFATALVVEQEPLTLSDLPTVVMHWTQIVGVLAMVGMIAWLLVGLPMMRVADRRRIPALQSRLMLFSFVLAAICYVAYVIVAVVTSPKVGAVAAKGGHTWRDVFLTTAGALALFAACVPILRNLAALRLRRIWALARLSFQEAIRNRLLYACSVMLIFFLFFSWFRSTKAKPEEQVHAYISFVSGVMTIFLLVIAVIISAFSIPNDLKQQTIHTIITKPVERFEIVLGRFLGYMGILSLVLIVMSLISLLYVVRGVDPDAAAESLKARQALYGTLSFEGAPGESVGHEWEYRKYISAEMPGRTVQYAVWTFPSVPSSLAEPSGSPPRETIPCEFTFDIYRTTKGNENVGIGCAFVFTSWRFKKGDEDAYRSERNKELAKTEGRLSEAAIDNLLAEKYGYFEIPSINVTDYHTMIVQVPVGLFKNANKVMEGDKELKNDLTRRNQSTAPIQARVKCTTPSQFIGMAKYDLYFRVDNPDSGYDRLWFAWNFFKASFGLWLRLCLVTALAVLLSTYLTGVISLLITLTLYLLGLFVGFIQEVAAGKNVGGGPMEAALRLVRRDNLVTPLEETPTNIIAVWFDKSSRLGYQVWLNVIPDITTSNLESYVASGFNIGPERLVMAAILMFGYVLPWFLLGYYLIKWREIASSN